MVAVEVAASLFVAAVAVGAQPFVVAKAVGRAVAVVVAVLVLVQQFLPIEAVSMGVGVAVVEMGEHCPLTLVVFLVDSGPDVPLHCMLPQTQVLFFL